MAISNYSELKTSIETFRDRAGVDVITTNASDCVSLAEARLTRELPLRIMWTNQPLTGTIGSRELDLHGTYAESAWLKISSDSRFDKIDKQTADDMQYFSSNGEPTEWCINGPRIDLNRPCDTAYTFIHRYRAKFALSDADDTNWLLLNHPDIYLAAVLLWSGLLIKDDDVGQWAGILQDGMSTLLTLDAKAEGDVELEVDPALLVNRRYRSTYSSFLLGQ